MHVRKKLPSLGVSTFDSRTNNEEDADSMRKMELSAEAMRMELINTGKRDEMSMKHHKAHYICMLMTKLSMNSII